MEIVLTDQFITRVEKCTDTIALDLIPTAIHWAEGVFDQCQKLSDQPESGRIVPEFTRPEIRDYTRKLSNSI